MAGWEEGAGLVRSWVLVPTMAMFVPWGMEMGVPEAVMVPPGVRVWPAMRNWEAELAEYVEPAKVRIAGWEEGAGVVRSWVLVPMTATLADGARDSGVLDTVIWPPGVRVWPATTNCEAVLAVYVEPAKVMTAAFSVADVDASTWVLPATTATSADGCSDIGVLATVICPPGVNVWPAMTNPEAEFAVYVDPATETTCGDEGAGLGGKVPATRFPEAANE